MLTLYFKPTCPYCQRVLGEVEEMGLKLDLRDISADESVAAELEEKGGKRQVPFLVDGEKGTSMYESGDIIDYLKENYSGAASGNESFNGVRIHGSDETCTSCQ